MNGQPAHPLVRHPLLPSTCPVGVTNILHGRRNPSTLHPDVGMTPCLPGPMCPGLSARAHRPLICPLSALLCPLYDPLSSRAYVLPETFSQDSSRAFLGPHLCCKGQESSAFFCAFLCSTLRLGANALSGKLGTAIPKVVVITNPDNPTGTYVPLEDLQVRNLGPYNAQGNCTFKHHRSLLPQGMRQCKEHV